MGTPRHILLIDDESSVLSALKLVLKVLGHQVREFSNPLEALECLKSDPSLDLILCDLKMPVMNGIQFLEAARQAGVTTPFFLMSGHAVEQDVAKAKALGAAGFLGKPFTPQQLTALLESIS